MMNFRYFYLSLLTALLMLIPQEAWMSYQIAASFESELFSAHYNSHRRIKYHSQEQAEESIKGSKDYFQNLVKTNEKKIVALLKNQDFVSDKKIDNDNKYQINYAGDLREAKFPATLGISFRVGSSGKEYTLIFYAKSKPTIKNINQLRRDFANILFPPLSDEEKKRRRDDRPEVLKFIENVYPVLDPQDADRAIIYYDNWSDFHLKGEALWVSAGGRVVLKTLGRSGDKALEKSYFYELNFEELQNLKEEYVRYRFSQEDIKDRTGVPDEVRVKLHYFEDLDEKVYKLEFWDGDQDKQSGGIKDFIDAISVIRGLILKNIPTSTIERTQNSKTKDFWPKNIGKEVK